MKQNWKRACQAEHFLELAKNEKFYIYGTGFVAKRFYQGLERMNCTKNVLGFVQSERRSGEEKTFFQQPVLCIADISTSSLVFVATHFIWESEIKKTLTALGFQRYILAYEYINEFFFGLPIAYGREISVDYLIGRVMASCSIFVAAYYAALMKFFGEEGGTYELYLRLQTDAVNEAAARKRLRRFRNLVDGYRQMGEQALTTYPLKLNEGISCILDGAHRVMIAFYERIPSMKADIYPTPANLEMIYAKPFQDETLGVLYTEAELRTIKSLEQRVLDCMRDVR